MRSPIKFLYQQPYRIILCAKSNSIFMGKILYNFYAQNFIEFLCAKSYMIGRSKIPYSFYIQNSTEFSCANLTKRDVEEGMNYLIETDHLDCYVLFSTVFLYIRSCSTFMCKMLHEFYVLNPIGFLYFLYEKSCRFPT